MHRHAPTPGIVAILGLCLALLHTACASGRATSAQDAPSPTVWSARAEGGGQLFLLGSVRATPDTRLGPAAEWALADASELVLEVDYRRYDEAAGQHLADRYGRLAPPARLKDQVSADTYGLLEAWLARRHLFAEPFEHLQPWLVATAVTVLETQAQGYGDRRGIDRILLERAGSRKPVVGLETLESQLEILSGLPAPAQDVMLRDVLERSEVFRSDAARRIEAWQRGDDEALSRMLFEHMDEPGFGEYYEQSVFARSERMAERIAELQADGKTRLVVVDAAHMLGERGIPALLGRRGFEVSRVERR